MVYYDYLQLLRLYGDDNNNNNTTIIYGVIY